MGNTSSSQSRASAVQEGSYFTELLQTSVKIPRSPSYSSEGDIEKHPTGIDTRARLLRSISYLDVWDNFLNGSFASFALTPAEMQSILSEVALSMVSSKSKSERDAMEVAVKDYIALVQQLSEKDTSKMFDVMAVCSSILLLSSTPLEVKIDQLFIWITLDPERNQFTLEDFMISMSSFERGLSHAFGRVACSEAFVKEIAAQWMAIADPSHKGLADANTRVTAKHFFDFCLNRQFILRKLLESLAVLEVLEDKNLELQEVTDTVDLLKQPSGGDEWMANPAWKKTAERMLTKSVKDRYVNAKPSSNLELEWVHGYRGFDCRNNLRYADATGQQVVFSAAALGIVQDNSAPSTHDRQQFFFSEHGDDIICLNTIFLKSPSAGDITLIATGEVGKAPAIYLYAWHSADKVFQSLACLKGFHKKGVAQLAFSSDGTRLFSIGVEYSIAVYNTEIGDKNFGKMVSSSEGPKDRICHVSACGGTQGVFKFISCGEKHAVMWTLDRNNSLKQENVKLGSHKNKIFLCAANFSADGAILSSSEGDLFHVIGTTCNPIAVPKNKGHGKSAINALWSNPSGDVIVSGDKDGHIALWSAASPPNLTIIYEFDLTGYNLSSHADGLTTSTAATNSGGIKGKVDSIKKATTPTPAIRSVCLDPTNTKVLVGTQTCEIIECKMDSTKFVPKTLPEENIQQYVRGTCLLSGHYKDEVWGLAVRPVTAENGPEGTQYATVGDDGFLRIWSLEQHTQLLALDLHCVARACTYSPDGLYIAIGFGGGISKKAKVKEDGMVKILRFDRGPKGEIQLIQVSEIKEAKQWISVLRYSPDGSTLAVGSRDNSVYLYSVANQYRRKAKFSKHNAGITYFDFTADGRYLQSCCSAYEILFSDTTNGAQIADGATKLTEAEWHTWTCALGWPVIGIWSGSMDGSDINNVDRSPSKKYLATCDDFGMVNLYRYPAIQDKGAAHNEYNGHSSHVTCVRWASVFREPKGGIFRPIVTDDYLISTGGEDKCVFQWRHTESSGSDDLRSTVSTVRSRGSNDRDDRSSGNSDIDDLGLPSGGDEFMAVKPWLGAIVAPSAWKTPNPQKVPPFQAALGDFCNQHRAMNDAIESAADENTELSPSTRSSIYADLVGSADTVLQRMYESGVVDHSLPNHDDLELEWVYGYNGYDCRNNIFYVNTSTSSSATARYVVYHAAALGILLDPEMRTQKFYRGHNDDITSMALFEKKDVGSGQVEQTIVATGQIGKGNLYVWEVPSLQTLSVLATNQKTVLLLSFSVDGRYLISFGEDQTVVVSDWKSQTILANSKADGGVIFDIAVLRSSTNGKPATTTEFLATGDKSLKLWTVNGRNVSSTKYTNSAKGGSSTQQFLSCVEIASLFFVGCEDGSIYVIPHGDKSKSVKEIFSHHPAAMKEKLIKSLGKDKIKKAISVTSMSSGTRGAQTYLLSGSKDGVISLWDASSLEASLTPRHLFSFEIATVLPGILAKQIQSLNMHASLPLPGNQLLLVVGTRGCDVIEVLCDLDAQTAVLFNDQLAVSSARSNPRSMGGVLVRAHCNDEVWGLSTHPSSGQFCSVGDDKTLRLFDLASRVMLKCVPLGHVSRACCYNHTGEYVALGFGGRVGRGKETGGGLVRIYRVDLTSADGVTKLCERQDAKQWISDIKFSADSLTLVAGAHDCKIYIYNVNMGLKGKELTLRSTFMKHNAVINHLDLSLDGRFMQSNCSGYELLFCDTTNGKQITSATEVKDVKWQTWTCTLGWPVQGIWAAGLDGSDINAVCRSHTGHLVATSDDNGKVNLYRYPTLDPKEAKPLSFAGHSSHVMNVQWTCGDECLISAGGNDKCLFQWRHRMAEMNVNNAAASVSMSSTLEKRNANSGGRSVRLSTTASSAGTSSGYQSGADSDDDTASVASDTSRASSMGDIGGISASMLDGPSGGDESGAVKPWVGAVKPPKNPPAYSANAPAVDMELSWVHGYSSSLSNCRPNLFYNFQGQLVYPAAALGVLLDRGSTSSITSTSLTNASNGHSGTANSENEDSEHRADWRQVYFRGHDDDVTCLTMSRDRRFIATGQIASKALKGKASVIVWDATQGRLLSRMEACHQRGVYALAFSPDGQQLISVGMDDSYTHILWADMGGSWSRVQQLSNAKGDRIPTLILRWVHNKNTMVSKGEYHFVSGGNKVLSLWKIEGSTLTKKQARVGKKTNSQSAMTTYTCLGNYYAKEGWKLCLGTANGDILTLDERELQLGVEKAHAKAIYALAEAEDGSFLVTGGKDCFVKIWNQQLQLISSFDLHAVTSLDIFDAGILSLDVRPAAVGTSLLSSASANATSNAQNSTLTTMTLVVGTGGGDIIEFHVPATASNNTSSSVAAAATATHAAGQDAQAAPPASRTFDLAKAILQRVVASHYKGELWGLAPHPENPDLFASCGDDRVLRVWSIAQRRCLEAVPLSRPARVLAWHPAGHLLAVGLEEDRKANQKLKKAANSGESSSNKKAKGGNKAGTGTKGGAAKRGSAAMDEDNPDGGNPYVVDEDNNDPNGMSGGPEVDESGGIRLFSFYQQQRGGSSGGAYTLSLRASGCYPKTRPAGTFVSVSDLKFAPDGGSLFVGGHDSAIHGFRLPMSSPDDAQMMQPAGLWSDFQAALDVPCFDFQKHSSAITHFDVSVDGLYLQSNDLACELLFYDLVKQKQEVSATKMAEYHGRLDDSEDSATRRWLTQHCVFGWSVQGIWPANAYDSSEINSVDRSVQGKYLATGEDSGQIRILRYPSVVPSSQAVVLRGHSSHVTNVRWTIDNHLVSVGGNDKCVFVWTLTEK